MTKHRFRTEMGVIIHIRQQRRGAGCKFGPTSRLPLQPTLVRLIDHAV